MLVQNILTFSFFYEFKKRPRKMKTCQNYGGLEVLLGRGKKEHVQVLFSYGQPENA